jgi:hypothetical protein
MKFEFGDLYKFVVSLGVVLISLSILAPWLFLKEPFDLFKTQAELTAVNEVARNAILQRQETVAFILRFLPWFSAIGFVCGAAFIYVGLKRWHANQLLLDEQTKIEVELKKQSLRDATKDEIALAAASDLEVASVQKAVADEYKLRAYEATYAQLEKQVADRLRVLYPAKYGVELNKMIGGVEIDILLRGKTRLTKDMIIEIKSIRRGFNYGWLREVLLKNIYAKNIYAQLTNRIPDTLLLIVLDLQSETPEKYKGLLARVSEEGLSRSGKDRVVMLTKEELATLPDENLQERLGVYA